MMLRYSFSLNDAANCIEAAVDEVLNAGYRTADIVGNSSVTPLSTSDMTKLILSAID